MQTEQDIRTEPKPESDQKQPGQNQITEPDPHMQNPDVNLVWLKQDEPEADPEEPNTQPESETK